MTRRLPLLLIVMAVVLPSEVQSQGQSIPHTMAMSRNRCDWSKIDELTAFADTVWVPLAQGMVDEGVIESWSAMVHQFGDEWNFVWTVVAGDREALFAGLDELDSRVADKLPDFDLATWLGERCFAHEDLIYRVGPRTTPTEDSQLREP